MENGILSRRNCLIVTIILYIICNIILFSVNESSIFWTNVYIGVWFTCLSAYSILEFYLTTEYSVLSLIYFSIVSICSFITFICYSLIPDSYGIVFNLFILMVSSFSIYHQLISRNGKKENLMTNGEEKRTASKCASLMHHFLRFMTCLFSILLVVGGIVAAFSESFSPRGIIYPITLSDGTKIKIHSLCVGPKNSSLPVMWIVASGAHGTADFYGVQYYLNQQGYRVCTYDQTGFGWSSFPLRNANEPDYLDALITASGESTPITLLASVGGVSECLDYSKAFPSKVKAVILIDSFPEGVEFTAYRNVTAPTLTDSALVSYAQDVYQQRIGSGVGIIIGLAIPWGLMPLFDGIATVPKGFYPIDRAVEYKAQAWKSKFWLGQISGLQAISAKNNGIFFLDSTYTVTLPSSYFVASVVCNQNASSIKEQQCYDGQSPSDCQKTIQLGLYEYSQQIAMSNRISANGPNIVYISDVTCDDGLVDEIPITVANIVGKLVANVTISN